MIQNNLGAIIIYQFKIFQGLSWIYQFTTTRQYSPTGTIIPEFNLGITGTSDAEKGIENRRKLAGYLKIPQDHLLFTRQVHDDKILTVNENFFKLPFEERIKLLDEKDALITSVKNCCICALGADCCTILLYDPKQQISASVHAGWRGTVKLILNKVIEKMKSEWKCHPSDIIAGIGPCISAENYEVGEEVALQFELIFGKNPNIIQRKKEFVKPHVNVPGANYIQLLEMGVHANHIEESRICTYDQDEIFYSARKGATGRFCSGLMMINKQ